MHHCSEKHCKRHLGREGGGWGDGGMGGWGGGGGIGEMGGGRNRGMGG